MGNSSANPQSNGRAAYSFGPFELRIRDGALLRNGKRVRIQELPLKMLLVLLENHGEVVSRQELQVHLWGQETFVEVDNGLHVVAGKLREALGDRAVNPVFIKTVSGRGYCFIGEVETAPAFVIESPIEPEPITAPEETGQAPARQHARPATTFRGLAILSLAFLVLTVVCFLVYRYMHRPLIGDQDRVVVGAFVNSTGNSDLDGALTSAVQLKLQESPYLSVIAYPRLQSVMKDADPAPLKAELEACTSLDGQLLIKGELEGLSSGYRIVLTAWSCRSGRSLTTQKTDADSQAAILPALDLATERMRRRLGESESSLQKFNVPLMQATTASLTALKAFTLGEEKRSQGLQAESIASYKLAVDLDSQFALAYARLGNVYSNIGQISQSRDYYRKAFELRNRTTDRERLYIITHYYAYTTGEIKRAIADYELWLTLYPRDLVPTNNLAAGYLEIGISPERALQLAHRAVDLDPTNKLSRAMLGQAELKIGDYAGVNALCRDSERANNDFLGFHEVCFQAAFAQDEDGGMQRELRWARGNPEESELLNDAALVAICRGKMSEARRLFSEAKQTALRNNFSESAGDIEVKKAAFEADLGLLKDAKEDALAAARLSAGDATEQAFAALALARSGEIAQARAEAAAAASLAPLDTVLNSVVLASVDAAISLEAHAPDKAVQALEEARPFDSCDSMRLAPGYYRGLAYLHDKRPQEAAQEFQRVVDHRTLADYPLYVNLSRLEMGHSYQLLGDRVKAKQVFDGLDRIWKDADPGFPPLIQLRGYERFKRDAIKHY